MDCSFNANTCEMVETSEEELKIDENPESSCAQKSGKRYSIEDDINRLLQAIDIKNTARAPGSQKSALKKPIIVTSEPVSLKQALRGLCISQASEMAALKRMSKLSTSSRVSTNELGSNEISNSSAHHSTPTIPTRSSYRNQIVPIENQVLADSSRKDYLGSSMPDKEAMEANLNSPPSSGRGNGVDKPTSSNTSFAKPIFKDKNFLKKKVKQNLYSSSSSCSNPFTRNIGNDLASSTSDLNRVTDNSDSKNEMKENKKLSFRHSNSNSVNAGKRRSRFLVTKYDEKSRSKDKSELSQSQSPKSSTGDYCSMSEESNLISGPSCRPHMSKHARWEAIRLIEEQQQQHGNLSWRNFKMLKRLGRGDIGTVYLAQLIGTSSLFALKVVENDFLVNQKKKMSRARTEREILQMLDHPFLPTLYAHFETDKLSCLVMEYCPGGDLHVLRQRQPSKSFSEHTTRFYVAEVLLALEYLHMLGVVYRDLKPENILLREDGHIMLTDYDLSLRCSVNPMLVKSSSSANCMHPFCLQPDWHVPSSCTPILAKSRKISGEVGLLPQIIVEPTNARSNSFVGTYEYLAPEIIKGEGHGSAVDWWTFGILMFELLYGITPFKGPANQDTLANVVSQRLEFPDTPPIVSFRARDLIKRLLIKDPQCRLGFVKGAAEIRQHCFFEGLNWALIRSAPPPKFPHSQDCQAFDMF